MGASLDERCRSVASPVVGGTSPASDAGGGSGPGRLRRQRRGLREVHVGLGGVVEVVGENAERDVGVHLVQRQGPSRTCYMAALNRAMPSSCSDGWRLPSLLL